MAIYFVDTAGVGGSPSNSNPGTISSPWLTISYGVAQLASGDTLYLRAGTYSGAANRIDSTVYTVPGNFTILNYNSESVIIQPPDATNCINLSSGTQTNITIQGLILDGSLQSNINYQGIYISGTASYININVCSIRYFPNFGISLSNNNGSANNITIYGCAIHGNGSGSLATNGHGIYNTGASDVTINNCTIYNNLGYGIHNNEDDGLYDVNNCITYGNLIYNNGRSTTTSYGIVDDGGEDNLYYNNIIYDNYGGISIYSNSKAALVYNNTIYNNNPSTGSGGIDCQYYATAPTIENNIVYNNNSAINDYGGSATIRNNYTSNPLFVNAGAGNFQLQATSLCIGAGLTIPAVTIDFAGNPRTVPYTIGAYQYLGSVATITGAGSLLGVSPVANHGVITGIGSLAGVGKALVPTAGTIVGGGALAGIGRALAGPTGALGGGGALAGVAALLVPSVGTLAGSGSLAGVGSTGSLPPNILQANAIELGPLSNTLTQRVDSGGTTYAVWYKYTALTTGYVSIWAYGDLTVYTPHIVGYQPNAPIELYTVQGTVYYFHIATNSGNPSPANLTITGSLFVPSTVPVGSLAVPDVNNSLPLCILSTVSGQVIDLVNNYATGGYAAESLPNGTVLIINTFPSLALQGYGTSYTQTIPNVSFGSPFELTYASAISSDRDETFYITGDTSPSNDGKYVTTVSAVTGQQGTQVWQPTVYYSGIWAIAPSRDNTILYYISGQPSPGGSGPPPNDYMVRRWDLINNVALSSFPNPPSFYISGSEAGVSNSILLVLEDDTILALFIRNTNAIVIQYSPTGTVLNTITLGGTYLVQGIQHALDDPNSFWVMAYTPTTGANTTSFLNIQVSTGLTLFQTPTVPQFQDASYAPPETLTPAAFFGPSDNQVFFLINGPPPPPLIGNGGIYYINLGKTNDTIYYSIQYGTGSSQPVTSVEIVPIPNPYFIL
jgi:hypothetical protein